ncbi:deoxynucleoside kinase [Candidatus Parcubacteria bacterium]|jgi:dTMP kinase|nr:deoxynucleoside kinase [Candidatus Parcubacteria bacterium]MBT7228192.1 deoxynucleoside kinase [Candidatus Parcubacteria bacterium]
MKKGKFIVIDGTDGSGKGTQVEIMKKRLLKEGKDVAVVDFPRYGKRSAFFVEKYLNGEYGGIEDVGPKMGSTFYALDRFDSKQEIVDMLEQGKVLLANRYVSASMGHQGSKISDLAERKEFLDWLHELEYEIFAIPKPDVSIILHVSADISQKLVDKKGHRDYVGGEKRDLHESNKQHLKDSEATYLQIVKDYPDFHLIECVKDDDIMSREEIHDLIWNQIKHLID